MATKKKTNAKKTPKISAPVHHQIDVNADAHGNFTYLVNGKTDGSSIRPKNGDTVSWSATLMGFPVPFQVEFSGFSPFGPGNLVTRSLFQSTSPLTVNVPPYYHGNLVFKYTVTLANGWSDDPDIIPVPSDGVLPTAADYPNVISLSIDSSYALALDKPNASYGVGEVVWQWSTTPPLDDFSLTFDDKVPTGWTSPADSQAQKIALDFETTGSQNYTIQTANLGLSVRGKLTITK
jgi:hypothetical protein